MKIICIVALIQNILYSNVSKYLSTGRKKVVLERPCIFCIQNKAKWPDILGKLSINKDSLFLKDFLDKTEKQKILKMRKYIKFLNFGSLANLL